MSVQPVKSPEVLFFNVEVAVQGAALNGHFNIKSIWAGYLY